MSGRTTPVRAADRDGRSGAGCCAAGAAVLTSAFGDGVLEAAGVDGPADGGDADVGLPGELSDDCGVGARIGAELRRRHGRRGLWRPTMAGASWMTWSLARDGEQRAAVHAVLQRHAGDRVQFDALRTRSAGPRAAFLGPRPLPGATGASSAATTSLNESNTNSAASYDRQSASRTSNRSRTQPAWTRTKNRAGPALGECCMAREGTLVVGLAPLSLLPRLQVSEASALTWRVRSEETRPGSFGGLLGRIWTMVLTNASFFRMLRFGGDVTLGRRRQPPEDAYMSGLDRGAVGPPKGRWVWCRCLFRGVAALVCFGVALPAVAGAATFTVTIAADSGPGSLRQAIMSSNDQATAGGKRDRFRYCRTRGADRACV